MQAIVRTERDAWHCLSIILWMVNSCFTMGQSDQKTGSLVGSFLDGGLTPCDSVSSVFSIAFFFTLPSKLRKKTTLGGTNKK